MRLEKKICRRPCRILFHSTVAYFEALSTHIRCVVQGRAQKFEKGGGAISCLHVSTENSVKTKRKKGLYLFRRPIHPPKSSEDQKNINASSHVLFPLFR